MNVGTLLCTQKVSKTSTVNALVKIYSMHNYTVCQKETRHSIIGHNFGKFGQILKINGSF